MEDIINVALAFLAILNPFALSLYLTGVMDDLSGRDFRTVFLHATVISFVVFVVFAFSGKHLLSHVLGLQPAALRTFGGIIFFVVGYGYVTKGFKAMVVFRGGLDELPSEIALPFMIGAGTITQSIIIGETILDRAIVVAIIALSMLSCAAFVIAFKALRDHMTSRAKERVFYRYVNILSRINGLLIGALSTEMVVGGVRDMWQMIPVVNGL